MQYYSFSGKMVKVQRRPLRLDVICDTTYSYISFLSRWPSPFKKSPFGGKIKVENNYIDLFWVKYGGFLLKQRVFILFCSLHGLSEKRLYAYILYLNINQHKVADGEWAKQICVYKTGLSCKGPCMFLKGVP